MNELQTKIKTALKPLGISLYDTNITQEDGRNIFQVFIIKQGGVSLDDCVNATKLISPILDIYDPIQGEYSLEVSSPGVERTLKTKEHFMLSIGEDLKLNLTDKTKLSGTLTQANQDNFSLQTKDEILNINYADILKAKTTFKW